MRNSFLLRYLITVLGSRMAKADELSRRPDWYKEVEKDNKDRMLVKPE